MQAKPRTRPDRFAKVSRPRVIHNLLDTHGRAWVDQLVAGLQASANDAQLARDLGLSRERISQFRQILGTTTHRYQIHNDVLQLAHACPLCLRGVTPHRPHACPTLPPPSNTEIQRRLDALLAQDTAGFDLSGYLRAERADPAREPTEEDP
jgi:hypothetical protein